MIVNFSLPELLYLDDGLTLLEAAPKGPMAVGRALAPMAITVSTKDLLMQIGTSIIQLEDGTTDTLQIDFTETDLWTLREVSQSSVQYNGIPVGISIKRKVYTALRDLRTQEALKDVDLPPIDETLSEPIERRKYLDIYHIFEDDTDT
tara:strand:+ start:290 stop:733 length:444 start_codon:yes stop_codon:yes gene_type:complete